jgi:phage terminase Nu1 subunit (DNA packaging protein)
MPLDYGTAAIAVNAALAALAALEEDILESIPDSDRRRRELLARLLAPNGQPRAELKDAPPLNSAEVASLFRMSERAIRVWAAKGELPHMRTLGGGRLLYPADAIAALYARHYSDAAPRRRRAVGSGAGTRGRAS